MEWEWKIVHGMGLVEILFTNLARVHACNLVHKLIKEHDSQLGCLQVSGAYLLVL